MSKAAFYPLALVSTLSLSLLTSLYTQATIVEFETSHGNFKVNLHDKTTPKTVENFLNYVNNGDYTNTIVHRLVPDFIMQSGGYYYDGTTPLPSVEILNPVINEPIYSNVPATIAMAKTDAGPHTATSQWFINYKDSSANLDFQNGGFTVFGEVIGDGMDIINAIAEIPLCGSIPMPDYSSESCKDPDHIPGIENFVTIYSVTIFDATEQTDGDLASVLSIGTDTDGDGIENMTDLDDDGDGVNDVYDAFPLDPTKHEKEKSSGGSGGTLSYGILAALSLIGFRRKTKVS